MLTPYSLQPLEQVVQKRLGDRIGLRPDAVGIIIPGMIPHPPAGVRRLAGIRAIRCRHRGVASLDCHYPQRSPTGRRPAGWLSPADPHGHARPYPAGCDTPCPNGQSRTAGWNIKHTGADQAIVWIPWRLVADLPVRKSNFL